MFALKFLIFIAFLSSFCESKVYSRCGFKDELVKHRFSSTFIPHWACMVDQESGRNTSKVGYGGPDGSRKYGIFQLNSKDHCDVKKKGGMCNLKCDDLLDENIRDDTKCAKLAHKTAGFKLWEGWVRVCKDYNQIGDYVAHCPPYKGELLSSDSE